MISYHNSRTSYIILLERGLGGVMRCVLCFSKLLGHRIGHTCVYKIYTYKKKMLGGHKLCTSCTSLDTFCPEGAIKPEVCSIEKFCDGESRQDRPEKPYDVQIQLIENRNTIKVRFTYLF